MSESSDIAPSVEEELIRLASNPTIDNVNSLVRWFGSQSYARVANTFGEEVATAVRSAMQGLYMWTGAAAVSLGYSLSIHDLEIMPTPPQAVVILGTAVACLTALENGCYNDAGLDCITWQQTCGQAHRATIDFAQQIQRDCIPSCKLWEATEDRWDSICGASPYWQPSFYNYGGSRHCLKGTSWLNGIFSTYVNLLSDQEKASLFGVKGNDNSTISAIKRDGPLVGKQEPVDAHLTRDGIWIFGSSGPDTSTEQT